MIETYPNPFNSAVQIKYNLEKPAIVQIDIYNLLGQQITTLKNGYKNSGSHSLIFNPAHEMSSGTYLIRFSIDNQVVFRKITYLK